MRNILPISFDISIYEDVIESINGITFNVTPIQLTTMLPSLFFIESDTEGIAHFCTFAAEGIQYPSLTINGNVVEGRDFVNPCYLNKQDGDRVWHPTTKPPRPIL